MTSISLPTGTVTFLFTDIEGSTQRWDSKREAMQDAVRRHDEILREAIESRSGHVFKTVGDAFCAAFSRPEDAIEAALEAQRKLFATDFSAVDGLHVRVSLHTGTTDERNGDYFGPTVNKVARLLAVGHGGQILLSGITADLVRDKLPPGGILHDLGRHRLKDLAEATEISQLTIPELPQEFPELRSLDAQPNNLPVQLTAFIGREDALREAKALLDSTRLLTLAGTGGVGKTRVAIQVAADVSDRFPDGVWFVDLSSLSDGMFISPTMLSTIGVREEGGRDTTETLTAHLREKSALVVLDNCEHVVTEAARLAERLLRDCSKLKILVTTREPLGIAAETVFRVSTFSESDGVRLFLTRARAVAPSFEMTEKNAELVGQICRRLDGIALAIELAAARVKMMSVDEIWKRLDDRFRILTGGSRTALARQQTLRGLIEWSYNLLDEAEKVLLRRLAVFAGDFSLDTATAVCAFDPIDEFEALDVLTHLFDKSLVQFEPANARYWLLDSTKAFVMERLADTGEWEALQRRKVAHFGTLAEQARVGILEGRGDAVKLLVARDYADYRSVMQWALVDGYDVRAGAATAAALHRYWQERGLSREGRFWLERVLDRSSDEIGAATVALAHWGLAAMALVAGDVAQIEAHSGEAFRIYSELGDPAGMGTARNGLAIAAEFRGQYQLAHDLFEENLTYAREAGDDRLQTASLLNLATTYSHWDRRYAEGARVVEEAIQIIRKRGDSYQLAVALGILGRIACYVEDFERADLVALDSLEKGLEIGDEQHVVTVRVEIFWYRALSGSRSKALESFGEALGAVRTSKNLLSIADFADAYAALATLTGDPRSATAFHAFAREQRRESKVPLEPPLQERYDSMLAAARAALGDDEFAAAEARGRALSIEAMFNAAE